MHNEMPACMFHRCFLSGVSVPLKSSNSQVVEAVCILLCQKYPETQMTFGAGKTLGFNNLLDGSFDVEGWRRAYLSRWKLSEHDCSTVQGSWSFIFSKMVQGQDQKGDLCNDARVRAAQYVIGSLYRSSPCSRDVILYSHCPGPSHHFLEPEDTTRQARIRSTTGTGVRVGPRIFCSTLPASATITGSAPIQVCSSNNCFIT